MKKKELIPNKKDNIKIFKWDKEDHISRILGTPEWIEIIHPIRKFFLYKKGIK